MKTQPQSKFPVWLAVIAIAALLATIIGAFVLPAHAAPQSADLHGSCVWGVQEWHNTEYLQAPGCAPVTEPIESNRSLHILPVSDNQDGVQIHQKDDVVIIIDDGGVLLPTEKSCKNGKDNINRQGHHNCSGNHPDNNSGQQNTTQHGNGQSNNNQGGDHTNNGNHNGQNK